MKTLKTTWVLVTDTYRMRLFNVAGHPNTLIEIKSLTHPEARQKPSELGSDKPGRAFESTGHSRSAIEPHTTPHEKEVIKFAAEVFTLLEQEAKEFDTLHVIAPPNFLGHLRQQFTSQVKAKVCYEIAKDLVDAPLEQIQQAITAAHP